MLTLKTAPAVEPITIAQAKAQARVDTDNQAEAIATATTGTAGNGSFAVAGDVLALLIEGESITVSGSTGNDGTYTIRAGSSYSSGAEETTINVDEAVANGTADGTLTITDPIETELSALITTARQMVELSTHRVLISQVWELHWRGFPGSNRRIVLPKPNLITVDSVEYTDPAGEPQTLNSALYEVTTGAPGELQPVAGQAWPETADQPSAMKITFTAGYGAAAADVPATLKHAIKLIVSDLYNKRDPRVDEKRSTVNNLLDAYTIRNRHMLEFV